jgi:hypothetical protein
MLEKESQFDVMRGQDFQRRIQMQEARNLEELQSLRQQLMAGESQQAQAVQGLGQIATAYGTAQTAAATMEGKNTNLKKPFGQTKVGGFLGNSLLGKKQGGLLNKRAGGLLGLLGKGGKDLFGLIKGLF